jgi:hypothetical protein
MVLQLSVQHIAGLRAIRDWIASLETPTPRQKAEIADRLRRIAKLERLMAIANNTRDGFFIGSYAGPKW